MHAAHLQQTDLHFTAKFVKHRLPRWYHPWQTCNQGQLIVSTCLSSWAMPWASAVYPISDVNTSVLQGSLSSSLWQSLCIFPFMNVFLGAPSSVPKAPTCACLTGFQGIISLQRAKSIATLAPGLQLICCASQFAYIVFSSTSKTCDHDLSPGSTHFMGVTPCFAAWDMLSAVQMAVMLSRLTVLLCSCVSGLNSFSSCTSGYLA